MVNLIQLQLVGRTIPQYKVSKMVGVVKMINYQGNGMEGQGNDKESLRHSLAAILCILQCIQWTWYLANDMQFYIVSPLFIYVLYR